jgi:hypothetical protein
MGEESVEVVSSVPHHLLHALWMAGLYQVVQLGQLHAQACFKAQLLKLF